jgi:hypothetical protein
LDDLLDKLWREDADQVRAIYDDVSATIANSAWRLSSYHRRREQRKKRRLLSRRKPGLTLNTIAKRANMERATLTSLLEHYGLLELVQYGLDRKRRMVTKTAYRSRLGHNVNPANRIGHLEGYGKAASFPVFYEDQLADIFWMLDFDGIKDQVQKSTDKKTKLKWLLSEHGYLPDQEIATLAGYSRRAVISARHRCQPKPVPKAA